ncbi:MAG: hypothetical protein ABIZ49_07665, partial [Opitutaceae bacterium]
KRWVGHFWPRVLPMKLFRVVALASLSLAPAASRAAEATSPLDPAQRNAAFSPAATVTPAVQTPQSNRAVQDRRVETSVREKLPAAVGDRRAPIGLQEAEQKRVQEKQSQRPRVVDVPASAFNHRTAAISTAASTKDFPRVAKYQDSLTAASATNMARFPASGPATVTTINRFVFRKNAPESPPVAANAVVVPAGGVAPPK